MIEKALIIQTQTIVTISTNLCYKQFIYAKCYGNKYITLQDIIY